MYFVEIETNDEDKEYSKKSNLQNDTENSEEAKIKYRRVNTSGVKFNKII